MTLPRSIHVLRALLAHWRRHGIQALACLLGIAVGVAVVTAMDIANSSALRSFRESVESVSGAATHQVRAAGMATDSSLDEALFAKIATLPDVIAAPVIESHGLLVPSQETALPALPSAKPGEGQAAGETVRILGIDPFSDRAFRENAGLPQTTQDALNDWLLRDDGCVIHAQQAERLKLAPGSRVTVISSGKRQNLRVLGVYGNVRDAGGNDLLFMDIAAAQERFGMPGRISVIDLRLAEGGAGDAALAAVRAQLPAGVEVDRPGERAGRTEALLAAFQLNLRALSLLALVVGIFLVYNTLTVAVLQRVPMLATLRCLGAAAADVRRAVMLEALFLGTAGSLLGLLGGTMLAGVFLDRVGGTVSDLYAHLGSASVFLDPLALAKGMALGLAASLLGAYPPAWEAGRTGPSAALRRSRADEGASRAWPWLLLASALLAAFSVALALWPSTSPVLGLAAAFALALAGAFAAPAVASGLSAALARPLSHLFGTVGLLAARSLGSHLSRTGPATGALALALSMTLGVAMMVQSFRGTVGTWMEQALHADYYMRPAGPALLRHNAFIPNEVIEKLRTWPEVEAVDTYRGRDVVLPSGAPILAASTEARITFSRALDRFPIKEGTPQAAYDGLLRGEVLISEPFARKHGGRVGGSIDLPGADGALHKLTIAAIYYEYGTERGVVSMDRATFTKLFGERGANSASLYLKPGIESSTLAARLRSKIGAPGGLYIFSNRTLKDEALRVFDRTFTITSQLETLSLVAGLCGIAGALLALLQERATEYALLRALGLSARGAATQVMLESILLVGAALVVAFILGPLLALLLIHVINLRAFGWTIVFAWHGGIFVRVALLSIAMAVIAALWPARKAATGHLAAALRDE